MVISGFQIILQECLYCANGQNIETKQKQCRLLYELPLIYIHDEERERERERERSGEDPVFKGLFYRIPPAAISQIEEFSVFNLFKTCLQFSKLQTTFQ